MKESSSRPRASVAVSTYQRAERLPQLVRALEGQTLDPGEFEVVICDNGSSDDTADVLRDLSQQTRLQLRVVRLDVNRGPARGRNAAWRAARAPLVAFTDDDCLPQPGWLEAGLAAMGDGKPRVVVGRTEPPPDEVELTAAPFARVVQFDDARFFPTCNAFYRRADLEDAGGFDEGFEGVGGEDTDLGLRVVAAGAEPAFASTAVVHHPVRPSDFVATMRESLRWTGIPRVVRRHPTVRRDYLTMGVFWKPSHPTALLALAGLAAAPKRPAALALAAPWIYHRVATAPVCPGPRRRWLALPGAFAVDLAEVWTMIRGSIRARTLVL